MAEDGDGIFDSCMDSWETLLDSGALEKKIDEIKIRQAPVQCETEPRPFVPVILQEDVPRTPYAPPQPQVKILKRPSGVTSGEFVNGERVTKQPPKSLQQREAEYAEARLRILGAAKNEEDIVEERLEKMVLVTPIEGAKVAEAPSSPSSATCAKRSEPPPSPESVKPLGNGVAVIRQPRGPDGTSGFTAMR